jgi:hypothetical protein
LQPARSCARARLGRARNEDHRRRPQSHDLLEKGQPVHPRHLDIERHDVWIQRLDHLPRLGRIGGVANHRNARLTLQPVLEERSHQRGIVYDQHSYRHAALRR